MAQCNPHPPLHAHGVTANADHHQQPCDAARVSRFPSGASGVCVDEAPPAAHQLRAPPSESAGDTRSPLNSSSQSSCSTNLRRLNASDPPAARPEQQAILKCLQGGELVYTS
jgi:hypothetical protein